jgi:hypothetical protein
MELKADSFFREIAEASPIGNSSFELEINSTTKAVCLLSAIVIAIITTIIVVKPVDQYFHSKKSLDQSKLAFLMGAIRASQCSASS